MPGPTVKRTTEALSKAGTLFSKYSGAPVSAAVNESFDFTLCGPRDDDRIGANVVHIVIANARNVFFSTRPLPALRPHARQFFIKKMRAGVAARGEVGIS
jgi:hypothetical protein